MRLFSKNLLMSKIPADSEYEILDSLKINYQCFFILDEFQISAEDIEVEMVAHMYSTSGREARFYVCGSTGNTTAFHTYTALPTNSFRFFTGKVYWATPTNNPSLYYKRKIIMKRNPNGTTTSSIFSENGDLLYSLDKSAAFASSVTPFKLFGNYDSDAVFDGMFYSFKVTQNDDTVIDLVPARRITDGELGLLNKVDGTFYENQGSGIIERGEEIA